MAIHRNEPLSTRAGIAVTLAIIALVWYAISSGWLNFKLSSGEIERRRAKVSRIFENERASAAIPHESKIANDLSTTN